MPVASTGAGVAGDWSQQFNESGVGSFNEILVFSTQGDGLASPGLTDVTNGWTETDLAPSGYAAELAGAATTSENFYANFLDPGTNDVFDFFALNNGVVVDSATIDNFGQGTSIGYGMYIEGTTPNLTNDLSAVTPEPSSLLLLGTGLLGAAGIARRKFAAKFA